MNYSTQAQIHPHTVNALTYMYVLKSIWHTVNHKIRDLCKYQTLQSLNAFESLAGILATKRERNIICDALKI